MQETKIGIVEDEIIIADSIRSVLKSMNYNVPEPCADYKEAIAMLQSEQPDLVLLDINLDGNEMDGIAVARYIREHMDMPFIFLTANSDPLTLSRAKTVTPNAFLVKPFQRDDLYAAIEIAMHNFYTQRKVHEEITQVKTEDQHLFIKEGTHLYKVDADEILYLESDHVYVHVHTAGRKYLVRTSLQHYLEQLDEKIFIRIHRGFVVNKSKIEAVTPTHAKIGSALLPVSKKYRALLLASL